MSTTASDTNQKQAPTGAAGENDRAAIFAAKASQRAQQRAGATPAAQSAGGSGTITYNVFLTENGGGFAVLNWSVSSSLGQPVIGDNDWIGVFSNTGQAMVNPKSNYLGGSDGWEWASDGGPYTTDVPLQQGYVAAYVIENGDGNYVTVAVTSPYPG